MNKLKVEFSIRKYFNAHGQQPRGFGAWMMEEVGGQGERIHTLPMTYSTAKREITKMLRERGRTGFVTLEVMP